MTAKNFSSPDALPVTQAANSEVNQYAIFLENKSGCRGL